MRFCSFKNPKKSKQNKKSTAEIYSNNENEADDKLADTFKNPKKNLKVKSRAEKAEENADGKLAETFKNS